MSTKDTVRKGLKTIAAAGFLAAGGWLLLNRKSDPPPLTNAIDARRVRFTSASAGPLVYYADTSGSGTPVVLIHSINAAPSSHEMRPLFEHYRGKRPVYALDLPGFGFSDRSDRRYSIELYRDAIVSFLQDEVGESADIIALSLGCEFAAHAALTHPEWINSLALISPSGLRKTPVYPPEDLLYGIFSFPLWSQSFYSLLVTRRTIRYYLGKSFVGDIPDRFVDYAYLTSHQPGARYAPLYFISGQLFTPEVASEVYNRLTRPVLVLYDRDPNVSFDGLPDVLATNPLWRSKRMAPSLGLPHWEKLPDVAKALDHFWSEIAA